MDSVIRSFLGIVCLGAIISSFAVEGIFPWYLLIPLVLLVPFFLKTGATKVCPIMKAMGVSAVREEQKAADEAS